MFKAMARYSSFSSRRGVLAGLFGAMILHLVGNPLLTAYWLSGNNGPALSPEADFQTQWISDEDFRGLDQEKGSEYRVPGGGKTYMAGETWQRLRPYYITTPDGAWHLEVLARGPMTPYAIRAVVGTIMMPLIWCLVGLALCLLGPIADKSMKKEGPPSSWPDLE